MGIMATLSGRKGRSGTGFSSQWSRPLPLGGQPRYGHFVYDRSGAVDVLQDFESGSGSKGRGGAGQLDGELRGPQGGAQAHAERVGVGLRESQAQTGVEGRGPRGVLLPEPLEEVGEIIGREVL